MPELIDSGEENSLQTQTPDLKESLVRLQNMLEIKSDQVAEVIQTVSIAEITPELIQEYIDIPEIQKASLSTKTTMTQIPFYIEVMKTQPKAQKAFNSLLTGVGLIALYSSENPKNKPPFTKNEDQSGWDLSQVQIDEFKKALRTPILEQAQAIIDKPEDFQNLPEKIDTAQMITAIAYLKVRKHLRPEPQHS